MRLWNLDYTEEYQLLDAVGDGGEGTVYHVSQTPGLVAKVYNEKALARRYPDASGRVTWTMQEKICHMASVSDSLSLTVKEGGDDVLSVAWPYQPLMDENNRFVGFLMPRMAIDASGLDCVPDIHFAYRPRERRYLFGDEYTWLTAIKIAVNLAAVVRNLHKQDIVIGDFNCNNILIDRDAHVVLIDADSFCVYNAARKITYKCTVGIGEFIAPELQGVDFAEGHSKRTFTRESDCFSLAVHIFMLLMNGTHPFSGNKAGTNQRASSSTEPYVNEIATGACPYVTGSHLMPFADTPSLRSLPLEIRQLFDAAFGYGNPTGQIRQDAIMRRPTAAQWEEALRRLYDECAHAPTYCPRDASHINHPSSNTCMWCELDGKLTSLEPLGKGERPAAQNGNAPRKRITARTVLLALAIATVPLASLAAAGFMAASTHEDVIQAASVPSVVGEPLADAKKQIEKASLQVGKVEEVWGTKDDEGKVIEQNPEGMETADKDSKVNLRVSKGEKPVGKVVVPSLVGKTADDARALLEATGLVANQDQAYSASVDKNKVVSQSINANEEVEAGTTVSYVVSLGQELITVPDVSGTLQDSAMTKLQNQGFNVVVETVTDEGTEGIVCNYTPEGPQPKGATITIYVTKKPEPAATETAYGAGAGLSERKDVFWGVWTYAAKDVASAGEYASQARRAGFPAEVFMTTDWENLNTEPWYVVSLGCYSNQEEAEALCLRAVEMGYRDAYVKWSGIHRG